MLAKSEKDLEILIITKCLEGVIAVEPNHQEQEKMQAIANNYEKCPNKQLLLQLNDLQTKLLTLLVDGFNAYKEGFFEVTKLDKYAHIAQANIDIDHYLLEMQKEIKVTYK